jgi:hypothetical protein
LSATDASKGAGNGIPGWTQIGILHAGSSGISSDCASNDLDDQIDNGAGHCPPPFGLKNCDGEINTKSGGSGRRPFLSEQRRRLPYEIPTP